MLSIRSRQAAVSLVEVLIAMAILSTLALPLLMFLFEYSRGSSQLGDYYQILNIAEEKLDTALSLDFGEIPNGETVGGLVATKSTRKLDLRPSEVARELVTFRMKAEVVAVEFSAMKDSTSGQLQRARVEDGMKRIELIAEWGKKKKHSINLVSYKANL